MSYIHLTQERWFIFWSGIGPLFAMALVLLLAFFPTPIAPLLALTILLGLPACWIDKKWGMLATTCMLAILSFCFFDTFAKNPLWFSGVAFSILLTLYIFSHSIDEILVAIDKSGKSSGPLLTTIENYQSEIESLRNSQFTERQAFQEKIAQLSQELGVLQRSNQQLKTSIENAQVEMETIKKENILAKEEAAAFKIELETKSVKDEHVLQELLEKRKEVFLLRDQLQELQNEPKMQAANRTELDQNWQELLNKKDQDLFNLQFRLESALEDIQVREKEIEKFQEQQNELKNAQETAFSEIESLRKEKDFLEFTVHRLQNEQEMIPSLINDKEQLESSIQEAFKELEIVRHQLNAHEQASMTFNSERKALESSFQKVKKELEEACHQLKAQENVNIVLQSEKEQQLQKALKELEDVRLQFKACEQEGLVYKEEREALKKSLQEASKELDEARHQLKENVALANFPEASHDWKQENALRRRAEGMYLQLKGQFSEKAAILDETRRQLFHIQEHLLQVQRDLKEQDLFAYSPESKALIQHILKMQNFYDRKEKFYAAEIEVLQEIITKLS